MHLEYLGFTYNCYICTFSSVFFFKVLNKYGLPYFVSSAQVHEASQAISGDSHVTSKGQLRELSHEVYQFGLSGFDFENKEKLEVQRAIKLGAKVSNIMVLKVSDIMVKGQ